MPPLDWSLLLQLGHWFESSPGPPSDYYFGVAQALAVALGISLYYALYWVRRKYADHPYKKKVFSRLSWGFAVLCGLGLLLVLARYLEVPVLSARVLLFLDLLGVLGLSVFTGYYLGRLYPRRLAESEAKAIRQKYLPRPGVRKAKGKKKHKKDRR